MGLNSNEIADFRGKLAVVRDHAINFFDPLIARERDAFTQETIPLGYRWEEKDFWHELSEAEQQVAIDIALRLAKIMGEIVIAARKAPLITEEDIQDLTRHTKKMRAALFFREYEYWDTNVLHDEGTVLGVSSAGQSDEKKIKIVEARKIFEYTYNKILKITDLLTSEDIESTVIAPNEPTEVLQEQISTTSDTLVLSGIAPWTLGFLLAGRFKLLRQLAHGGFGEAWLVEDIATTSPMLCVVKKFSFQHSDTNILDNIRRRFEQESKVLERLGKDHDQIPSLYTFDTEGDEGYFIQEYVEGPNLAEYVRDNGPMSEQEVLDFLDSVLEVLSYVHSNKMIHRDIKPANIILRKADRKPVLIDFGALKEITTTVLDKFGHASTTLPIGTPGFMPFEQVQGMPRLSSDIYALGFTALYLLSGKFPADLIDIATGEVEWSILDSILSSELRTILTIATAQMPNGRFNTARLMRDEISKLIQSRKSNPQISDDSLPHFKTTSKFNILISNRNRRIQQQNDVSRNHYEISFLYRPQRGVETDVILASSSEEKSALSILFIFGDEQYNWNNLIRKFKEFISTYEIAWISFVEKGKYDDWTIHGDILLSYFPEISRLHWLNTKFMVPPLWHSSPRSHTSDPVNSSSIEFILLEPS